MIESLHVIDERELREQLKSGWLQSKIRENHSKYPRVGRSADIVCKSYFVSTETQQSIVLQQLKNIIIMKCEYKQDIRI